MNSLYAMLSITLIMAQPGEIIYNEKMTLNVSSFAKWVMSHTTFIFKMITIFTVVSIAISAIKFALR